MEIVLDVLENLIYDSRNICWCFTLNDTQIKLTSLIICSINDSLYNTSSTAHLIIFCTSAEASIYWKFKGKIFNLFEAPNEHNCCVTILWKFLQVLISCPATSSTSLLETKLGCTWTHLLVTDFLCRNPSLYKSSRHKQNSLITTSKIIDFLAQLQIAKSYNFHLKSPYNF